MTMFKKPQRRVERVFIHCSANDSKRLAGKVLVDEIRRWHTLPKPRGNGWSDVGYQFMIDKAGLILPGRSLERMPAAQYPHNPRTIAIMVHGLEDFPAPMLDACKALCVEINEAHEGRLTFHGHSEVSTKTCPVFDYTALLQLDRFGRMP